MLIDFIGGVIFFAVYRHQLISHVSSLALEMEISVCRSVCHFGATVSSVFTYPVNFLNNFSMYGQQIL